MQIWYPGPDVQDDGDYAVTLNPGCKGGPFAIIGLSENRQTALIVQSPEEADRLIKAAVKAKQLLSPADDACRLTAKGEAPAAVNA